MSKPNMQTVNTVADILSLKASPVTIANAASSAKQGDAVSSALAVADFLQVMTSLISKKAAGLAPPLLVANMANDIRGIQKDVKQYHGITNQTILAAASNLTAAMAWMATGAAAVTLGAGVGVAIAATGIVASAGLAVWALS